MIRLGNAHPLTEENEALTLKSSFFFFTFFCFQEPSRSSL